MPINELAEMSKLEHMVRTYALGRCGAGEARTTSTSILRNSFGLRKS